MALENQLIGGTYLAIKRIGGGAFGDIYSGVCVKDNTEVAIKVECPEIKASQLSNEAKVCQMMSESPGFPQFLYYGNENKFKAMAIELLGPSLHDLFLICSHHFSLKTILMLGDQMMSRLEAIHAKGYIHCDIKPENFLMGRGDKSNLLFLIDFGMAQPYRNPETEEHVSFSSLGSIFGTLRYLSLRAQRGVQQSRRDDLESFMYCLIYFYEGQLPWIGLVADTEQQKAELTSEIKNSTPIDELCKAFPPTIVLLMKYVRNLRFDEDPDYVYMRLLLRVVFLDLGHVYDMKFDWVTLQEQQKEDSECTEKELTDRSTSVYRSCLKSPDVNL